MAERPAFFVHRGKVISKMYTFQWYPGFAVSQKQKSIESLHGAIRRSDPGAKPLEVSTKSAEPVGRKLSAFHLRLDGHTLENIFQSSKVFERGGPFPDLLKVPPREAKRDARLRESGPLTAFRYGEEEFPLLPRTVFYDYIYLAAVRSSLTAEETGAVSAFDYFTDIEFNPTRSLNTQARTAALLRLIWEEFGTLPDFSKDEFIAYHRAHVIP